MQTELDSSSQDVTNRQQLELQVDSATKEVQLLQGQLSDLNCSFESSCCQHKAGKFTCQEHAQKIASNHTERQRVDSIYANKAAKQRQTKEVQNTAEQIQKQLEQKVHAMSMDQQQNYYTLQVLGLL